MTFLHIFTIAVALAMDAFAVALATGMALKTVTIRQTFRLSWHFGLFQALMPMIGWSAGLMVRSLIERYDHWVAFSLLAFVGGHMIKEALFHDEEKRENRDPTKGLTLIILSIAVSIDALAVGLSLAMIKVTIFFPAFIIGVVALVFTVLGLHLSKVLCRCTYLSKYAEVFGGVALLLIGLNILREHGALPFL